ncbi:hypothetical protein HKD37_17G048852 [Glycine soja]
MKRGFPTRQSYGSLEEARLSIKYYSLLEDCSKLQKECVSKKRKLQEEKQKREILLDEVRFLRQQHKYLTKIQAAKVEPELGPSQNADIHNVPIEKERNFFSSEISMHQESNGREELVGNTLPITDKPLNLSNKEKKSGKKKVSWNDDVVVIVL